MSWQDGESRLFQWPRICLHCLHDSPTLIANLWDVTDRDIDKFSQAVFEKVHLSEVADVKSWASFSQTAQNDKGRKPMSIVRAVAESRDVCKLKYLTGAAPVVYGIPFYL